MIKKLQFLHWNSHPKKTDMTFKINVWKLVDGEQKRRKCCFEISIMKDSSRHLLGELNEEILSWLYHHLMPHNPKSASLFLFMIIYSVSSSSWCQHNERGNFYSSLLSFNWLFSGCSPHTHTLLWVKFIDNSFAVKCFLFCCVAQRPKYRTSK